VRRRDGAPAQHVARDVQQARPLRPLRLRLLLLLLLLLLGDELLLVCLTQPYPLLLLQPLHQRRPQAARGLVEDAQERGVIGRVQGQPGG
jgi:hypothetical protein